MQTEAYLNRQRLTSTTLTVLRFYLNKSLLKAELTVKVQASPEQPQGWQTHSPSGHLQSVQVLGHPSVKNTFIRNFFSEVITNVFCPSFFYCAHLRMCLHLFYMFPFHIVDSNHHTSFLQTEQTNFSHYSSIFLYTMGSRALSIFVAPCLTHCSVSTSLFCSRKARV